MKRRPRKRRPSPSTRRNDLDVAPNLRSSLERSSKTPKRRSKLTSFLRLVRLTVFFLPLALIAVCKSILVAIALAFGSNNKNSFVSTDPNETVDKRIRKKESAKDRLGRMGEEYFLSFIENMPNCEPIATNLENFYCEMDVVYLDKESSELVFVEIKTRRRESSYHPTFNAVNSRRQKKMALAARNFAEQHGYGDWKRRFDVAVIIWKEDESQPYVSLYQNVFTERSAIQNYAPMDFGKNRTQDSKAS